jgi:ubiquinone/menaquinone biosynthesis C-methylase UbiE
MKDKGVPTLDNARQYYQGRAAEVYEARRAHKPKWKLEHECLKALLAGVQGRVLDVPVGTGRFLGLYKELGLEAVGVDYSLKMLACAHAAYPDATLEQGDVTNLRFADGEFDAVVCVRLLHLVAPNEAPLIMSELFRVSKHHVMVTVPMQAKAYIQGRSQVHKQVDVMLWLPKSGWRLFAFHLLMYEKGMPYYMLHYVR